MEVKLPALFGHYDKPDHRKVAIIQHFLNLTWEPDIVRMVVEVVKPGWVEGKDEFPIMAVDIHPNASKFATGRKCWKEQAKVEKESERLFVDWKRWFY